MSDVTSGRLERRKVRRHGFTLIELLVVVSIIALLIALLLPAINKARSRSRAVVCSSNLHQVAMSMLVYAADNNNGSFLSNAWPTNFGTASWFGGPGSNGWLQPYYKNDRIIHCPEVVSSLTTCNYGAASIGGVTRTDLLVSPVETAMVGDEANINGSTTRNPSLNERASLFSVINAPSTFLRNGDIANNTFVGRHDKLGNVGWYDGHVSLELPWMNADYLAASGFLPSVQTLVVNNHLGTLTPLPISMTYADFLASPRKDYYFWVNKVAGFGGG